MQEFRGDGTVKQTSLACENISFLAVTLIRQRIQIYMASRQIASGFSYAEVSATFRCSRDMREKDILKHGKNYHIILKLGLCNIMKIMWVQFKYFS